MRLPAIAAYTTIAGLMLVAATVATHTRYDSLHPCDWLRVDAVRQSGLPDAIVKARIRAQFLLQGVINPGPSQCVSAWWRVRRNGLPEVPSTR